MNTSRSLIFSAALSGIVFSTATLVFIAMGSRPLTIQVEEKPVFTGRIQDLATPYLTIATGLSLGVGIATVALAGWRNTSQKLNQATEELSELKHQVQQQESMVESLKFSEAKLQATGLSFFLESLPNPALAQAASSYSFPPPALAANTLSRQPEPVRATAGSAVNPATQPVEARLTHHSQPYHSQPHHSQPHHSQAHHSQPYHSQPHHSQAHHPTPQFEELKTSLKQIMNQIEQMQAPSSSS